MNTLTVITLAAVAACGSTQYYGYPGVLNHGLYHGYNGLQHGYAPHYAHHRYAVPYAPILAQYHSQDSLGQYSFGYAGGLSDRAETRDAYGNVRGHYSYIDSNGQLQTQYYVADALGFRVSGTNLPVNPDLPALVGPEPVTDTPEVTAAKAEFQVAFDAAVAAAATVPKSRKKRQAPEPVQDTAEVAQAKVEFQAAYEAAAAAAEAAPDKGPLDDYAPVYPSYDSLSGVYHGYSSLHYGHHGHHFGYPYLHHPHGFSYSHGYAFRTPVYTY